jgi:predicted ribosome quality control (RQC) complex YloA/Tae2 family protein
VLPDPLPEGPFAANHALDRLFRGEVDAKDGARAEKDLSRLLGRLRRAREAVDRDRRAVPDAAALRADGELLLIHFPELKQGMSRFGGVTLDPKLSPPENVERVFEQARKAERAVPALERRAAEIDALIARVEAGEEVPESRLPGRKGGPQPPRKPYRVFVSADGRRILAGKGGRDNDETTLKVAGPHDLFLHVRGMPGSHVIVPLRRDEEVLEQTLLDAATIAMHYSKARSARSCEVTYTRRKHVSKPKGAKAGLVRVQQEKVLQLRREPDRLARLLMTVGEGEEE